MSMSAARTVCQLPSMRLIDWESRNDGRNAAQFRKHLNRREGHDEFGPHCWTGPERVGSQERPTWLTTIRQTCDRMTGRLPVAVRRDRTACQHDLRSCSALPGSVCETA